MLLYFTMLHLSTIGSYHRVGCVLRTRAYPQKNELLTFTIKIHSKRLFKFERIFTIYIPWAPKTMKNKGFGHLKTRFCTIKTSKNVGFRGPWYIYFTFPSKTCAEKLGPQIFENSLPPRGLPSTVDGSLKSGSPPVEITGNGSSSHYLQVFWYIPGGLKSPDFWFSSTGHGGFRK